jgi:hypothetical protein
MDRTMTSVAQRAEYRSTAYLTTPRDEFTVDDAILYLLLSELKTPADYDDLIRYLSLEERMHYAFAGSVA